MHKRAAIAVGIKIGVAVSVRCEFQIGGVGVILSIYIELIKNLSLVQRRGGQSPNSEIIRNQVPRLPIVEITADGDLTCIGSVNFERDGIVSVDNGMALMTGHDNLLLFS
jgi:hypothetical protein